MIPELILLCFAVFIATKITGISTKKVNPMSNKTKSNSIVEGKFTPRSLYKFNGHDDEKIFIAVKGTVFDVTKGRAFYGPSGPYSNFAGHDASRGLAKNSFEIDCITPFDKPIDNLQDLTSEEQSSLDNWEEHFKTKYPVVGVLIEES